MKIIYLPHHSSANSTARLYVLGVAILTSSVLRLLATNTS